MLHDPSHEELYSAMRGPLERTVANLFAEQVERTPETTAVIAKDSRLTYRELDDRSSRFASCLQNLGVKSDTLVGIATDRSATLISSLLGILKAGAAYVPLDPSFLPKSVCPGSSRIRRRRCS